jgi:hypothetical protein
MYTQLEHVMIRTDEFPEESPAATERLFLDRNVVLCTLSMLSNPALLNAHVFKVVPVEFLIIDEASQINISDYMVCASLSKLSTSSDSLFSASVRQVCGQELSSQGVHVWRPKAA